MDVIATPSTNFNERADAQKPSMIILHYTGTRTADEARARFCDANPTDSIGRISPHYMIDGDAKIYQFVDETKRAWHAGTASWGGVADINSASIGIEIWNTGHEFDFEEFLLTQIAAVIGLIKDIRNRWDINDRNILGHSDVAPGRKLDPGEKFPWDKLGAAGIGFMPQKGGQIVEKTQFFEALKRYGYTSQVDEVVLLTEFRRHYLPARLNAGAVDDVDCAALGSLLFQAKI